MTILCSCIPALLAAVLLAVTCLCQIESEDSMMGITTTDVLDYNMEDMLTTTESPTSHDPESGSGEGSSLGPS